MISWWHAFLISIQALTRIPVSRKIQPTDAELGHSILFYPVVGLVMGSLLLIFYALLPTQSSSLQAALLLVVWVVITGAIHLDGLANSADAWFGGRDSQERTMEILKDPHNGMAAVVAVTLVLIAKFASLDTILSTIPGWTAILTIPILARAAIIMLFLKTPYVNSHGLGSVHVEHLPNQPAIIVVLVTAALAALFLGVNGIAVIGAIAVVTVALRALMLMRLGGATGYTVGAFIELIETTGLVTMALVVD